MKLFSPLSRLLGGSKRASVEQMQGLDSLAFVRNSYAGIAVTPDTAMRATAVYKCVKVLSEDIASLPLSLFEYRGRERIKATSHPLYKLLYIRPNPRMTAWRFRAMAIAHMCLRGNAFAAKTIDGRGNVVELNPIHPDRITLQWNESKTDYFYRLYPSSGAPIDAPRDLILHLRGLSLDGQMGISPISAAKEAIGLSMAAEKFGATLFGNGARPAGAWIHKKTLSPQAKTQLRQDLVDTYGGDRMNTVGLLNADELEWKEMGMTSEDAQFLETRQFQASDIAGIFRVPPHKIGDLSKATFSNIEQQSIDYVTNIQPLIVNLEQEMMVQLLSDAELDKYFLKFNLDSLLRADTVNRYNAHNIAINAGFMSRNEVRELEDLNPEDGLDDFLTPLNMQKVGDPDDAGTDTDATDDPVNNIAEEKSDQKVIEKRDEHDIAFTFKPIFEDVVRRIITKECNAIKKSEDVTEFYTTHRSFVQNLMEPYLKAIYLNLGVVEKCSVEKFAEEYCRRSLVDLHETEDRQKVFDRWNDQRASDEATLLCTILKQDLKEEGK